MEDECQTLKLTKSAKDLASFVLFITNCLEKSITVKTFRYWNYWHFMIPLIKILLDINFDTTACLWKENFTFSWKFDKTLLTFSQKQFKINQYQTLSSQNGTLNCSVLPARLLKVYFLSISLSSILKIWSVWTKRKLHTMLDTFHSCSSPNTNLNLSIRCNGSKSQLWLRHTHHT